MTQRCPRCNGPTRVGYILPSPGAEFVPFHRASRADIEAAERKTRRCVGCGHEPIGRDVLPDSPDEAPDH